MKIMKLMGVALTLFCAGCASLPEIAGTDASTSPFAELRAHCTYFGDIETRNGKRIRGLVTWEPQENCFIIRSYRSRPPVTLKMPSEEVTLLRFRDLTEEEKKMIEDQN
jgi:hypothetical protein